MIWLANIHLFVDYQLTAYRQQNDDLCDKSCSFREAQIGGHTIYKVEDTRMIPIPNETVIQKIQHPDENK